MPALCKQEANPQLNPCGFSQMHCCVNSLFLITTKQVTYWHSWEGWDRQYILWWQLRAILPCALYKWHCTCLLYSIHTLWMRTLLEKGCLSQWEAYIFLHCNEELVCSSTAAQLRPDVKRMARKKKSQKLPKELIRPWCHMSSTHLQLDRIGLTGFSILLLFSEHHSHLWVCGWKGHRRSKASVPWMCTLRAYRRGLDLVLSPDAGFVHIIAECVYLCSLQSEDQLNVFWGISRLSNSKLNAVEWLSNKHTWVIYNSSNRRTKKIQINTSKLMYKWSCSARVHKHSTAQVEKT